MQARSGIQRNVRRRFDSLSCLRRLLCWIPDPARGLAVSRMTFRERGCWSNNAQVTATAGGRAHKAQLCAAMRRTLSCSVICHTDDEVIGLCRVPYGALRLLRREDNDALQPFIAGNSGLC